LKPEATEQDVRRLCNDAAAWQFASVCINPHWVPLAAKLLAGSSVRVCTVIGFPLGASRLKTKVFEAELALVDGATELDMVQNIGALRSRDYDVVRSEVRELAKRAHANHAILKVILETCLLSDDEKVTACRLAQEAGADFVKTSTGFSTAGATVADIALMRKTVGATVGVKASGGVRTLEAVRRMVEAGATRIGTSSGVAIIRELGAEATATASPSASPAHNNY
jgi:deoxyribose-phosphate aldolase